MFRHKTVEPTRVYSISSVPTSMSDDQEDRVRTYLLSMGIRTACFVAAGVLYLVTAWVIPCLLLLVGAIVLPYPAVVWANNSANRQSHFVEAASPVREIGTAEDQERSPGPGEQW